MSAKRNRVGCAVLLKHADHHLSGWLAWHLALGIDHIAVVTANPSDDTQQVLQAYQDHPSISWLTPELEAHLSPEAHRLELTRHALRHLKQILTDSFSSQEEDTSLTTHHPTDDWVIVLDADEYLHVDPDLEMRLCFADRNAAALAFNWRVFGSAGHLTPPKGHIVTNHIWHAPQGFYDHYITRRIVRMEHIPPVDTITNPFTFNIPAHKVAHASGDNSQTANKSEHKKWEGGCILHYICAQAHDDELSSAMRAYYDRNEVMFSPQKRQLHATRLISHTLREIALTIGLEQLKELVEQQAQDDANTLPPTDNFLGEHVQHATFSYTHSTLSRKDNLLLNAQFSAPYAINNTFLLRDAEGKLLECDEQRGHNPLIAVWQKNTPNILSLYIQDEQNFALGDAFCAFHIASMNVTYDPQVNMIRLPHETGQDNTLLELVPSSVPLPFLFTPLPPADEQEGLSLYGLLIWAEGHPNLHPADLQRALLLLTPQATQELRTLIPVLKDFLPLPTTKPAFML